MLFNIAILLFKFQQHMKAVTEGFSRFFCDVNEPKCCALLSRRQLLNIVDATSLFSPTTSFFLFKVMGDNFAIS